MREITTTDEELVPNKTHSEKYDINRSDAKIKLSNLESEKFLEKWLGNEI